MKQKKLITHLNALYLIHFTLAQNCQPGTYLESIGIPYSQILQNEVLHSTRLITTPYSSQYTFNYVQNINLLLIGGGGGTFFSSGQSDPTFFNSPGGGGAGQCLEIVSLDISNTPTISWKIGFGGSKNNGANTIRSTNGGKTNVTVNGIFYEALGGGKSGAQGASGGGGTGRFPTLSDAGAAAITLGVTGQNGCAGVSNEYSGGGGGYGACSGRLGGAPFNSTWITSPQILACGGGNGGILNNNQTAVSNQNLLGWGANAPNSYQSTSYTKWDGANGGPGGIYVNWQCIYCLAGRYKNGNSGCTQCPANYYCPEGSAAPIPCPGNGQSSVGSTSLSACSAPTNVVCSCPSDQFLVTNCTAYDNSVCSSQCPPGKYGAFFTNQQCWSCPVAQYNDQSGSSTCYSCADGKYANATGSTTCATCPLGKTTTAQYGYSSCIQVSAIIYIYKKKIEFHSGFVFAYVYINQNENK